MKCPVFPPGTRARPSRASRGAGEPGASGEAAASPHCPRGLRVPWGRPARPCHAQSRGSCSWPGSTREGPGSGGEEGEGEGRSLCCVDSLPCPQQIPKGKCGQPRGGRARRRGGGIRTSGGGTWAWPPSWPRQAVATVTPLLPPSPCAAVHITAGPDLHQGQRAEQTEE